MEKHTRVVRGRRFGPAIEHLQHARWHARVSVVSDEAIGRSVGPSSIQRALRKNEGQVVSTAVFQPGREEEGDGEIRFIMRRCYREKDGGAGVKLNH